ncbi:MAG: hypothetical protein ABFD53_06220 [Anaerolineaceae bacterium]
MPTKLSRYCTGIMEVAWLATIINVPIFFNVYSSRIFEPDKITLLRSFAIVIAICWIIKIIDEKGIRWENIDPKNSKILTIIKTPLMISVIGMVVIYLLSTIFSITPRTSWAGSYQRLQGAYTTYSYIIIFLAIAVNLRKKEQIERIVTAVILSSLPVSLYGVLQRYKIDPVPWAGEVAIRIAANMGNSIFVAAYLIMVFPLTIVRITDAFTSIMNDRGNLLSNFVRATAYVFIAALQVIALLFSGSRGPLMGWLIGSFFLFVVMSLLWRQRWLTFGGVSLALLVGIFLVLINIPNGPFPNFRYIPGVGRLAMLLDPTAKTSRVRIYIWNGAAELVAPHDPLEFPDGRKDKYNFLRPIIGYGPESMYVAYNPFYQTELTLVEKRNASPDRSHNETWDAMVTTGGIGLIVYLLLFGSIIYYGLEWLDLITSKKQRLLFFGIYIGTGILSAAILALWQGFSFIGVGLPFGMLIGVLIYLFLIAIFGKIEPPKTIDEKLYLLSIAGLLAAIVSHFAEINFGIAIAVTRTYFWIFAGLLFVLGYILKSHSIKAGEVETVEAEVKVEENPKNITSAQRKKRRSSQPKETKSVQLISRYNEELIGGLILAFILIALGFDFISGAQGGKNAFAILWNSLVRLKGSSTTISYGVLTMFLTSWIIGSGTLASEIVIMKPEKEWGKSLGIVAGSSLTIAFIFWISHSLSIAKIINTSAINLNDVMQQIKNYEGLITRYYIFVIILILIGGWILYCQKGEKLLPASPLAISLIPVGIILGGFLINTTNLKIIQADIDFKLADPFARETTWPVAIQIYDRALSLAPNEDFYYLFLGRAYLEYARTITDENDRENLMQQALRDLETAQKINPLNTDHTANLARLYSLWSSMTEDNEKKLERARKSDYYFSRAVVLSPNNSRLWGEWALLALNSLNQPDKTLERLQHSLELDPTYDWTNALLGEYYLRLSQTETVTETKKAYIDQALFYYSEAKRLASDESSKLNYTLGIAQLYLDSQQYNHAIRTLEEIVQMYPTSSDMWRYEQSLAQLYYQVGNIDTALNYAQSAMSHAPEEQKETIQNFIDQLLSIP